MTDCSIGNPHFCTASRDTWWVLAGNDERGISISSSFQHSYIVFAGQHTHTHPRTHVRTPYTASNFLWGFYYITLHQFICCSSFWRSTKWKKKIKIKRKSYNEHLRFFSFFSKKEKTFFRQVDMQSRSLDLKKGISIAIKIPYLTEEEKMTQRKLYLQQIDRARQRNGVKQQLRHSRTMKVYGFQLQLIRCTS